MHETRAASSHTRLGFFAGVVRRLCDALALAASRGVVHRDVKPENVMGDDEVRRAIREAVRERGGDDRGRWLERVT
jgi:serine/threonine protein kinase